MNFQYPLLFVFFKLISASQTLPKAPPLRSTAQMTQMDFLVTPDDFVKDEDVCYLVKQLHRPQSIQKFYLSAAQIYDDLAVVYREIQADAKIAKQFLTIMKKLATASLNEPLTVTNLMFAAAKHLRPLFTHKSPPIEEIFATISELEQDESRKMIRLMTVFFTSFTLREVDQLQNFINLVSLATLAADRKAASPAVKTTARPSAAAVSKSVSFMRSSRKPTDGQLDISGTPLEEYAERIRITISNGLAKMLILLDLFVTDPTVANRSINLNSRLCNLHLRRLALREKVPFEELDAKWFDPVLYRKLAINFSFDDWSPKSVSEEAMALLKGAAEAADKQNKTAMAMRSSSKPFSRNFWITGILILFLAIITGVYFYLKHRGRQRQRQEQQQLDLTSFESQSINEIVSKLEDNI